MHLQTLSSEIALVCPSCRGQLFQSENGWKCEQESLIFAATNGIADFILPHRRTSIEQFLDLYQEIRKIEGWGSENAEYYRLLPFKDITGRYGRVWQIRSKTFESFLNDLSDYVQGSARVLDLGAGNCWLSYRLSLEGHSVVAVDINLDSWDGLGAAQKFTSRDKLRFSLIRAEFNYLPFSKGFFDIIVFNASVHYVKKPTQTLLHILEFLKNDGILYVLDSPFYRDSRSGELMVEEKVGEIELKVRKKIPEEYMGSFLSPDSMREIEPFCRVQYLEPAYDVRWRARALIAKIPLRREPASFKIIKIKKK